MKTITEIYRDRLVAEAEEADCIGLTKIAENITRQIEKASIRSNDEPYTYAGDDFHQDVQDSLWNVVIRTSDFHGAFLKSKEAQEIVDYYTESIVKSIRQAGNIATNVGSYEPPVPGESGSVAVIDIEE
jgi:hypothetical protein